MNQDNAPGRKLPIARAGERPPEINRLPTQVEEEAHKRGYIAREMVQCTLPHSDPGDVEIFSRQDGNLTLSIRGGYDHIAKCPIGIPYGPIAKLLMIWICSEAVKRDDPRVDLVKTLGTFLKALGLNRSTGRGKRSDAKRVKEQLHRLLNCQITFVYSENSADRRGSLTVDMNVAPIRSLWWDAKKPDDEMLFESYIVLGREFFEAIRTNYVPVDLTIAGRLKRSPLALDLFIWMTYRLYRMDYQETINVSWRDIKAQFGANYKTEKNLRAAVRDAVANICEEWKPASKAAELSNRGFTLHGIKKTALPIQERQGELAFYRRKSSNPFDLTAAELLKAREHAGKYDVFAMRGDWETWCKSRNFVPEAPIAHFIDFLQKHRMKNG